MHQQPGRAERVERLKERGKRQRGSPPRPRPLLPSKGSLSLINLPPQSTINSSSHASQYKKHFQDLTNHSLNLSVFLAQLISSSAAHHGSFGCTFSGSKTPYPLGSLFLFLTGASSFVFEIDRSFSFLFCRCRFPLLFLLGAIPP